jgi:hypothetical protein
LLGHGNRPVDSVEQQGRAQMNSLGVAIYRKSGKHHDWNRVRHVPSDLAGRQFVGYGTGCYSVVAADSTLLIDDHKGAAGAAGLIGKSPALQPIVERHLTACEVIEEVHARQRLWGT